MKRVHLPRRALCAALAASIGLSGCAQMEITEKRIKDTEKQAVQLRDSNIASATTSTMSRTTRPRLAGDQLTLRAANALPAVFEKRITYSTQGSQTLAEVLESLSVLTGISITASEIAQSQPAQGGALGASATAGLAQVQTGGLQGRVQMEFDGRLRTALDEIATKNDASWRYTALSHTIEFFRYETRTLSVSLPRGAKAVTSQISLAGSGSSGGTGGGGGGSSGGSASVSQTMNIDPWGSIMTGIQTMLGESISSARPAGQQGQGASTTAALTAAGPNGRASASPDFGIITVTARPSTVERIASYVRVINARFALNVMIDVRILSLTLDRESSFGFNLDALYHTINGDGISIVGGAPLQVGTGIPGAIIGSIARAGSRWSGSEVVAKALQQFGNVSLQTHQQIIAINGQPAPLQIAKNISYLASQSSTTVPNVGVTETLTPDSRVVGFRANFIPTIQGDNRILLEYQMNIEALVALDEFSSRNSRVQLPRTTLQSLPGAAYVRDGQAIVLFAFDQDRNTVNSNVSLGGASKAGRNEREMLIVVIQVYGGSKDV